MRAREFVINIPINIKINGDGEPEISTGQENDESENDTDVGAFVPPLQQKIELMKATAGKQSKVISQLIADEDEPFEG